jgi:predicted metal-dependent HD superfamily phosphohydrolase
MSSLTAREILHTLPTTLINNHIKDFSYLCGVLDSHYGEPWRTYHNLNHITTMISDYFEWREALHSGIFEIESFIAILFHDIIYDVTRQDNEVRSADLFDRMYDTCFYRVAADEVIRLILATQHAGDLAHASEREQFIADLGLLGLSAPPSEVASNSDLIEQEYMQVYTKEQYFRGRMKFLNTMLIRPKVYYIFTNRNKIVKENIIKEMWRLTEQHDAAIR